MIRHSTYRATFPVLQLVVLTAEYANLIGRFLLLAGVVLVILLCFRVFSGPTETNSRPADTPKMDPEVVREKTERWADEEPARPGFPPGNRPNSSPDTSQPSSPHGERTRRRNGQPPGSEAEDTPSPGSNQGGSTKEFPWTISPKVTFEDVGGLCGVKRELSVDVLKPSQQPEKAAKLGVNAPNIVFYGPPGTGKTFLATALAGELAYPFVKLSGADIQSKWINESAQKVNDLFREARDVAAEHGGAVVFIDELDSVLNNRDGHANAHAEDAKVVNEFLAHLEDTEENNIVFIGATNRIDSLDDAGIRSGRIDKKVQIGPPDQAGRKAILRAQLAGRQHHLSDDHLVRIAARTEGFVAADLELLVRSAAKRVLARDGEAIAIRDVLRALEQLRS